eukprot:451496_1
MTTHSLEIETGNDLVPLMTDNIRNEDKSKRRKSCITITFIVVVLVVVIYFITAYFAKLPPFEETKTSVGLYGKWAVHGGNIKQQQRAPNQNNIKIRQENIKNVVIDCVYKSENGTAFIGYPTIDNDNNAYFCDRTSGYITSIDLDNNCTQRWRSHIGELLGHDKSVTINNYQTLTIFQDSNGDKGLLFGTPTRLRPNNNLFEVGDYGCYAVAIHLKDGSFWWKIAVGQGNDNKNDYLCALHGFTIDGRYAYGGMVKANQYYVDSESRFIGKYIKIDIDK